ncbi:MULTISPECIES: RNA-binding S4 domain-containing protein [Halobacillus]|nr:MULTISPECIES: RNA-binding S4 domain-containing protein [Halobacillus]ASF41416.1 hypothetical protein CEH05_00390 [Halobacillus halophilus]MCA1012984.1 RNA-binding S4 domain-containing protein [Halobacillus halophilus]
MRLDKFMKISRLIKRRTLAKEIADQGRISINGNQSKASSNVDIGDELTIQFGQKILTIEIKSLKENVNKNEAASLYEIKKEEPVK